MGFSGALTLTDLNDFITPSQACIKPVEQLNKLDTDPAAATTEIQIDKSTGAYFEVHNVPDAPKTRKLEQAQINLNDCLACSGCITSAESVLITLQSHIEVLNFLESNRQKLSSPTQTSVEDSYKIPIISISPQSLASLAAATGAALSSSSSHPSPAPTSRQILRRIRAFCTQSLGFAHAFDTTFSRHLSLREHTAEFMERRRRAAAAATPSPTIGESSEKIGHHLPMLASSCPGWICYAEKAHSEMLPFISKTKSPQQVMGTLVKDWMGERWGKLPSEIYHVTVMPCYDKKLEASRSDFYNEIYATRDVDCVITTGELELLMKEKGWDISMSVPGELDAFDGGYDLTLDANGTTVRTSRGTAMFPSPPILLPELLTHSGTSSGSYLHSIIAHLQATSPEPLALRVTTVRGSDYEEYVLSKTLRPPLGGSAEMEGEGEIVFKGAKCYGFRSLQNVVRRVGRERGVQTTTGAAGKMRGLAGRARARGGGVVGRIGRRGGEREREYDYVEVMACPGGCVNGGGQLKPVVGTVDEEGFRRDWEGSGVAVTAGVEPLVVNDGEPVDMLKNARWGTKGWTRRVEDEYWREASDDEGMMRRADELVEKVYEELCGVERGDEGERQQKREKHFRTQYKAVESEVVGLGVVW